MRWLSASSFPKGPNINCLKTICCYICMYHACISACVRVARPYSMWMRSRYSGEISILNKKFALLRIVFNPLKSSFFVLVSSPPPSLCFFSPKSSAHSLTWTHSVQIFGTRQVVFLSFAAFISSIMIGSCSAVSNENWFSESLFKDARIQVTMSISLEQSHFPSSPFDKSYVWL